MHKGVLKPDMDKILRRQKQKKASGTGMRILRNIRIGYLLAWFVAWNLLIFSGSGDRHDPVDNATFQLAFLGAIVMTVAVCLAIMFLPSVRHLVLRDDGNDEDMKRSVWLIVLVGGVVAIPIDRVRVVGVKRCRLREF